MNSNMRIMAAALALCAVFAAVIIGFLLLGRSENAAAPATDVAAAAKPTVTPTAPNAPPTDATVPGGAPSARILVIDRQEILRASAVGKDIVKQLEALSKQAEAEFQGEANRLRAEATAMQRDSAILAADARAQKQRDITAKQASLQKRVQVRQAEIQGAFANAQHEVESALAPILQQIIQERGGNMLIDRNAIVFSMVEMDITAAAIQRLDQTMPTIKVQLAALPPGAQLPAAPQPPQQ